MVEIYVALLNEGVDGVWRPVQAEKISENVYRISSENEYDREDETWEFSPGTVVICEYRKLYSGEKLVAVSAK